LLKHALLFLEQSVFTHYLLCIFKGEQRAETHVTHTMSPTPSASSYNSSSSAVLPSYQLQPTDDKGDEVVVGGKHGKEGMLAHIFRAFSLDCNNRQQDRHEYSRDQESSSSSSLSPEMQRLSLSITTKNDEENQQFRYGRNKNMANSSNRVLRLPLARGMAVSGVLVAALLTFLVVHELRTKKTPATTCPNVVTSFRNEDSSWDAAFGQQSSLTNLKSAAVAADHPTCSQMGLNIIQVSGGNAVDAAVTVALCLGVANPASSGMGGGAFILVHASREEFLQKQVDKTNNDNAMIQTPAFHDARSVEDIQNEKQGNSSNNKRMMMMMTEVVDCREVAPAAATQDMYLHHATMDSERGGLAIGVPGELRGLELLHARHGRLSWRDVLEPVARLAETGVTVNANLASEIAIMQKRYHTGTATPVTNSTTTTHPDFANALRQVLTRTNDWSTPLRQGDLLHNPALAKTLRRIQKYGANAIYKGDAAAQWAADIQKMGGIVTRRDLETYQATLRSPVIGQGQLQGLTVVGVPPPSSGGAAIIGAARFLAAFQASANSAPLSRHDTTATQHRMVEASKHAFAIRMSMSDPDYDTATVQDAVNDLVHSDYMQTLQRTVHNDASILPLSQYGGTKWAQLKDTDGQAPVVPDAKEGDRRRRLSDQDVIDNDDLIGKSPIMGGRPFGYLNDGGTSHFSILDQDGNAVSMTTSVNTYFGSNVLSPSTGIILSNTMDDFSSPGRPNYFGLQPSTANYIHAGKKPLSSMSPTLVFAKEEAEEEDDHDDDWGDLVLVLGAR
jgi:gamma-glutamyltranspeptidase